ncbi:hypothetical protein V2J09_004452 [Rumex salicifolius]
MGTLKLRIPIFLLHIITAIAPSFAQLNLLSHDCIDDYENYTSNSIYKSNLDKLLTEIPIAKISYGFYNFSAGQQPDQANAIALCRGDIVVADCNTCLSFIISKLVGFCPNQKEAIRWADSRMLRYSNRFILGGQWENKPTNWLTSGVNFANGVEELLRTLQNKTASGDSNLKFATREANLIDSRMVYDLMQCTPDLPPTSCLGRVLTPITSSLFMAQCSWEGISVSLEVSRRGSSNLSPDTNEFNEWIDSHQFIDMGFEGTPFTYISSRRDWI